MDNLERMAEIKRNVLQEVDRAEKKVKTRAIGMVVVEAILLISYLILMDYHERLHWLILVAALLTYGTITVGLATVMARIDLSTQRVIKAIKLSDELE